MVQSSLCFRHTLSKESEISTSCPEEKVGEVVESENGLLHVEADASDDPVVVWPLLPQVSQLPSSPAAWPLLPQVSQLPISPA